MDLKHSDDEEMHVEKIKDNINFLHQAISLNVTPKTFKIKTSILFNDHLEELEKRLIRKGIRSQYKLLNKQETILKFIHRDLQKYLRYLEYEELVKRFNGEIFYSTMRNKDNKKKNLNGWQKKK